MERRSLMRQKYIHHSNSSLMDVLKEVVFGMEDGMVSTLGSITGIAIGSRNLETVILAGIVIISVEAISMGIGSYISNLSEENMEKRIMEEEREELENFPEEEKKELTEMYLDAGWSKKMAEEMAEEASRQPELFLKEMAVHELKIAREDKSVSIKGGIFMFFSYIVGGTVPLISYFILPFSWAIPTAIAITLLGLFALGISTSKFSHESWMKAGFRMLLMGGIALFVGLLAGSLIGQ